MIPTQEVRDWMEAAGQPANNIDTAKLYRELVKEEHTEFADAFEMYMLDPSNKEAKIETLDGIVDTVWCLVCIAEAMGCDFDGAFSEVLRSNLSKIDPMTGRVEKFSTGKVKKPMSYSPPVLDPFIGSKQLELDLCPHTRCEY